MNNKIHNLVKIAIVLSFSIFFVLGFFSGLLFEQFKNQSCVENPLVYGITKLNQLNQDKLTCTCSSGSAKTKPFLFNEEGVIQNIFIKK